MGLASLRDLVGFPPIVAARLLMAQRKGNLPGVALDPYLKDSFADRDPAQAARWPVAALRTVDAQQGALLAQIGVNNVADLSALGDEADAAIATAMADNGFSERPSAPAALIPAIIGSVASSVRYTSFVQDAEVREFRFEVDKDCFFPLPLSGLPKAAPPGKSAVGTKAVSTLKDAAGLWKKLGDADPPSLADVFTSQNCPVIQLGYQCDHRQRWINLGTHLGEVVHSLSLAPGESRNFALVNWRRRQLTSIDQKATTQEQVSANFLQNRALEEVASAVAQEHQQGKTRTEANTLVTAGSFVAAGAVIGGVGLGMAGAMTGGVVGAAVSGGRWSEPLPEVRRARRLVRWQAVPLAASCSPGRGRSA